MDINAHNFAENLPDLLLIIACADYVAVDLEMSGIQVKDSLARGAVSMEQVYGRIKDAASTFETLQLGITACRWVGSMYDGHLCRALQTDSR